MEVIYNGFIILPNKSRLGIIMALICPFIISLVVFLRTFMALRRKGQSFTALYFRKILNRELISRKYF